LLKRYGLIGVPSDDFTCRYWPGDKESAK